MKGQGYLSLLADHTRLDGKSWLTVFNEIGKSYTNVGENLDGGAGDDSILKPTPRTFQSAAARITIQLTTTALTYPTITNVAVTPTGEKIIFAKVYADSFYDAAGNSFLKAYTSLRRVNKTAR